MKEKEYEIIDPNTFEVIANVKSDIDTNQILEELKNLIFIKLNNNKDKKHQLRKGLIESLTYIDIYPSNYTDTKVTEFKTCVMAKINGFAIKLSFATYKNSGWYLENPNRLYDFAKFCINTEFLNAEELEEIHSHLEY